MRTLLIALCLTACGGESEEPVADEPMVVLEKSLSSGPTTFTLYVEDDGSFMAVAADGWLPPAEDLPPCALAAGPRLVGTLSPDALRAVRALVADDHLASLVTIEPEGPPPGECSVASTYRLRRGWDSYVFAIGEEHEPVTAEALATIDELLVLTFAEGRPYNASDEARANERTWPSP